MRKMYCLVPLFCFLSGCAWLTDRMQNPDIIQTATTVAHNANTVGGATGIPYGGMALGGVAALLVLLFYKPKSVK